MKQLQIRFFLILAVMAITSTKAGCQTATQETNQTVTQATNQTTTQETTQTTKQVSGQITMPEILAKNPLKEQLNYIEEHTRIYDNYRAIREDIFQKIKRNVSDTLSAVNNIITGLNKTTSTLNNTIDSLRTGLGSTKTSLEKMTTSKNSISVFGLEIDKSAYNRIVWTILIVLIVALVLGFLAFKRNLTVLLNSKKEYEELKTEFEAYRKTSREAREKMTMDHFNEIRKLKGG